MTPYVEFSINLLRKKKFQADCQNFWFRIHEAFHFKTMSGEISWESLDRFHWKCCEAWNIVKQQRRKKVFGFEKNYFYPQSLRSNLFLVFNKLSRHLRIVAQITRINSHSEVNIENALIKSTDAFVTDSAKGLFPR
jgi:hypothetical protein